MTTYTELSVGTDNETVASKTSVDAAQPEKKEKYLKKLKLWRIVVIRIRMLLGYCIISSITTTPEFVG